MITREELDKLTTYEQVDEEIKKRKTLLSQMVGTLYPPIVRGEIDQLLRHKLDIDREAEAHA